MENLSFKTSSPWEKGDIGSIDSYSKGYMDYISRSLTERLAVEKAVELLEKGGFRSLEDYEASNKKIKAGDGIYLVKANKALLAFRMAGDFKEGMNMIAAHVDSPRLDLKPKPIEEKYGLAFLKTHYYGGIKKYQWMNIPLALVGTVVLESGDKLNINIGNEKGDPVFVISDLLPHLDNRKGDFREVFKGKDLNALAASIPFKAEDKKILLNTHF
ncbi:zinc-binding metallopeptidase family protein [Kosmotoga arenicorallina]|uniref:hypothetical protein n=1 Tax=Kosmotoga arenicorallina TaxID=688066 RepID=UPI000A8134E7|nr:hypothetical protein [Kosmotoga arenicorallina]